MRGSRNRLSSPGRATYLSWVLKADKVVSPLNVKVPMAKWDEKHVALQKEQKPVPPPPDYLRLEMRPSGLFKRIKLRPVLRTDPASGESDDYLTVPDYLKNSVSGSTEVEVTEAFEKDYRWYRFARSAGSLSGPVGSIIGASLVGVGAVYVESGLGQLSLGIGAVLTVLAAIAVLVSAWRAPV
jgi:hypothetical protein